MDSSASDDGQRHQRVVRGLRPGDADQVVAVGDSRNGAAPLRLRTLLGSCVALTWWHPTVKAGAMAHIVSAKADLQANAHPGTPERPQSWFADQEVPRLIRWARLIDPDLSRWHVKVFGGGRQFDPPAGRFMPFDVPGQNLAEIRQQLSTAAVEPVAWHVGGTGSRVVVLDLDDGGVWLSHSPRRDLVPDDPALRIGKRPHPVPAAVLPCRDDVDVDSRPPAGRVDDSQVCYAAA